MKLFDACKEFSNKVVIIDQETVLSNLIFETEEMFGARMNSFFNETLFTAAQTKLKSIFNIDHVVGLETSHSIVHKFKVALENEAWNNINNHYSKHFLFTEYADKKFIFSNLYNYIGVVNKVIDAINTNFKDEDNTIDHFDFEKFMIPSRYTENMLETEIPQGLVNLSQFYGTSHSISLNCFEKIINDYAILNFCVKDYYSSSYYKDCDTSKRLDTMKFSDMFYSPYIKNFIAKHKENFISRIFIDSRFDTPSEKIITKVVEEFKGNQNLKDILNEIINGVGNKNIYELVMYFASKIEEISDDEYNELVNLYCDRCTSVSTLTAISPFDITTLCTNKKMENVRHPIAVSIHKFLNSVGVEYYSQNPKYQLGTNRPFANRVEYNLNATNIRLALEAGIIDTIILTETNINKLNAVGAFSSPVNNSYTKVLKEFEERRILDLTANFNDMLQILQLTSNDFYNGKGFLYNNSCELLERVMKTDFDINEAFSFIAKAISTNGMFFRKLHTAPGLIQKLISSMDKCDTDILCSFFNTIDNASLHRPNDRTIGTGNHIYNQAFKHLVKKADSSKIVKIYYDLIDHYAVNIKRNLNTWIYLVDKKTLKSGFRIPTDSGASISAAIIVIIMLSALRSNKKLLTELSSYGLKNIDGSFVQLTLIAGVAEIDEMVFKRVKIDGTINGTSDVLFTTLNNVNNAYESYLQELKEEEADEC